MEPRPPKSEKTRRDWELEEQAQYEWEESERRAEEERVAADRDAAIERMVSWFFENFEDPQNEMHYDSEDGVYLYPYGGPFEAADMLSSFSDDYAIDEWIEAAVKKIERNGTFEWAPTSHGEYYEHPEPEIDVAELSVQNAVDKADAIGILLAKVNRLEVRLDEIAPAYGHNGPPEEFGVPPYDSEDRDKLSELVAIVRNEIQKTTPDKSILYEESAKAASIGHKMMAYVKKTADIAVQESTKVIAKYGTMVGLAHVAGFDLVQFSVELIGLASDILSFVSRFLAP
jgi:hypothetical protein